MSFIQNLFTSRDNNANSATYVGQADRLWWDPVTNQFYYSDGNTAGGFPVGGGNGNANPAGSNTQIQFNNNGSFGASANLTFNNASNVLSLGGSVTATGNVTANYFVGNGSQLTGLPSGGSNITVQNQGSTLTTAVNTINFTGNGVVASNVGNVVTVSVSGGGGTLPSQAGNAGKILSTDGVNPLWETMPGVFGLVIDGGDAAFASMDFIIDGGPA